MIDIWVHAEDRRKFLFHEPCQFNLRLFLLDKLDACKCMDNITHRRKAYDCDAHKTL